MNRWKALLKRIKTPWGIIIIFVIILIIAIISIVLMSDSHKEQLHENDATDENKDETFWETVDALHDMYLLKYSELVREISDEDNSDYYRESCIIELDALIGSRKYMPIYRDNENFYYVVREINKNEFADRMTLRFNATLKIDESW